MGSFISRPSPPPPPYNKLASQKRLLAPVEVTHVSCGIGIGDFQARRCRPRRSVDHHHPVAKTKAWTRHVPYESAYRGTRGEASINVDCGGGDVDGGIAG